MPAAASTTPSLEDNAALHAERMEILKGKLRDVGFLRLYGKEVAPQQYIDVGWGNDKDSEDVTLFGNTLPTTRCQDKPVCHFSCRNDTFHTIVAFDADYVDPKGQAPAGSQYLLWQRVNVIGDLRFSTGVDVHRWQPPHPLDGTGLHRIMVAVFIQTGGEAPPAERINPKFSRLGRLSFDIHKFAASHKLQLVGANCCRMGYERPCVDKTVAALRDRVDLDAANKKIVAEENDGVRKEFGAKSSAASPASEGPAAVPDTTASAAPS
eukprot:CAMPEP_0174839684 /NCGR_PEP_ID=MMETSP1114-20130205/8201_1 /TAXON_ID=312471 /ORGANISM="Neobodo designis, Strain CCAP 1951/1" /LENGTH=265 /DNA_ID=CAMNT_0016073811 /DNA_START=65 /DNA_END=862 /DNA_ORIENTATION=+